MKLGGFVRNTKVREKNIHIGYTTIGVLSLHAIRKSIEVIWSDVLYQSVQVVSGLHTKFEHVTRITSTTFPPTVHTTIATPPAAFAPVTLVPPVTVEPPVTFAPPLTHAPPVNVMADKSPFKVGGDQMKAKRSWWYFLYLIFLSSNYHVLPCNCYSMPFFAIHKIYHRFRLCFMLYFSWAIWFIRISFRWRIWTQSCRTMLRSSSRRPWWRGRTCAFASFTSGILAVNWTGRWFDGFYGSKIFKDEIAGCLKMALKNSVEITKPHTTSNHGKQKETTSPTWGWEVDGPMK